MSWETLTGDAASIATSVITVVLLVNIVLAIITMFRERREPSSLWAWILVMFFIPVLGFLLWVFVGRRLTRLRPPRDGLAGPGGPRPGRR